MRHNVGNSGHVLIGCSDSRDRALDDAMWGDPVVTRYIGGRPFPEEEVWARLLRYAGHWSLLGFGYWVVEEKATGEFLGEIGFADFKRAIDPPIAVPELGWVFATRPPLKCASPHSSAARTPSVANPLPCAGSR